MVGNYGVRFVRGLQDIENKTTGDLNTRPLKVSSCCKHFAAYDVEKEPDDGSDHNCRLFDARVHEQDMVETFLRPFEMCVKEGDGALRKASVKKEVKKETGLGLTFKKDEDFGEWYSEVVVNGEMIEYYIFGCYILRPSTMGIWENMQMLKISRYCAVL